MLCDKRFVSLEGAGVYDDHAAVFAAEIKLFKFGVVMMTEQALFRLGPGHRRCLFPHRTIVPVCIGPAGGACALAVNEELPDILIEPGLVYLPLVPGPFGRNRLAAVKRNLFIAIGFKCDRLVAAAADILDHNRLMVSSAPDQARIARPYYRSGLCNRAKRLIYRTDIAIVAACRDIIRCRLWRPSLFRRRLSVPGGMADPKQHENAKPDRTLPESHQ